MNPEIVKKSFPQFVINGVIGLAFIFILALIYSLHAKAEESVPNPLALDSKAPGFIEKLTAQCPRLAEQEPEVFEIAVKFAKIGELWREDVRERMETAMKRGVSAAKARRGAETMAFYIRPTVSSPWITRDPLPPWNLRVDQIEEWGRERDRLKAEKKQRFMTKLINQCPQLPLDVSELAYKEILISDHHKNKKQ